MVYSDIKLLIGSRKLPISATNEKGENVIVSEGEAGGVHYYETQTFQSNDWVRTNTYYADGTIDESYDK